ncbi:hypothetical protein ACDA63_01500 [Uliginosibacterium sp. sgz301328]|uniref:hypothetical protein n=1 Tax=Uliginosibacterium sp. sgz301328 TaxID=3243764 RepID=UPI00359CCADD
MNRTTARVIVLILVMGAEAWLLWPGSAWRFEWLPFVALVIALAIWAALEQYAEHVGRRHVERVRGERDALIVDQVEAVMPDASVVQFLSDHDFIAPFDKAKVDPLFYMVRAWRTLAPEFLNEALAQAATNLDAAATDLVLRIGQYTHPLPNGFLGVKPAEQQGEAASEKVRTEARHLNESANAFVRTYERFVEVARRGPAARVAE